MTQTQNSLAHRLAAIGTSTPVKKTSGSKTETGNDDRKKRGSGKFDESSVKRDKLGQFAKQSESKSDEDWLNNLDALKQKISADAKQDLANLDAEMRAMFGQSLSDSKLSKEAEAYAMTQMAALLSSHAKKYSSPGGKQLEYYVKDGESTVQTRVVSPSTRRSVETGNSDRRTRRTATQQVAKTVSNLNPFPSSSASSSENSRKATNKSTSSKRDSVSISKDSNGVWHITDRNGNSWTTRDETLVEAALDSTARHSEVLDASPHMASSAMTVDDFLAHYGVKGMKWGVRRNLQRMSPSERAGYIESKDKKWHEKVQAKPQLAKVSRIAARDANRLTKKLKADYKERGLNIRKDSLARTRYDAELKNILEDSLQRAAYKVHKFSPTRLSEMQIHRHPDGSITAMVVARHNAKIVKQRGKIAKSDAKRAKAEAKAAKNAEKAVSHADDDLELSDEDFVDFRFILSIDDDWFVDDVQSPDELTHFSDVDDFLAHYGVKGMKWGVRRSDSVLDRLAAKRKAKKSGSGDGDETDGADEMSSRQMRKAKTGTVVTNVDAEGNTKTLIKKEDGGWEETRLSADAERFIKTTQKPGHEMSNQELKEALNRARMIEEYDKFFGPKPNAELKKQVEQLELQKKYSEVNSVLHPSRKAKVAALVTSASAAYLGYKKLDNASGGALSKNLASALGTSSAGKHRL